MMDIEKVLEEARKYIEMTETYPRASGKPSLIRNCIAAIEQLRKDIFDLKADFVQAGNDACVMRGKINQLQAENEKAKTFMAWVDECRTHKPQHPDDEIAWIPRMLDWKQEAMALRSRVDKLQAENADLKARLSEILKERDEWQSLAERVGIDNNELRARK